MQQNFENATEIDELSYQLHRLILWLCNNYKITADTIAGNININPANLSKARNTWNPKKKGEEKDSIQILKYIDLILSFYKVDKPQKDKKIEHSGRIFTSWKFEFLEKGQIFFKKKHYVYYYVNRENSCKTALLTLTNTDKEEIKIAELETYKNGSPYYLYKGKAKYDSQTDSLNIFLDEESEGSYERNTSIPSFSCFDAAYGGIRIGTFSSAGNEITSGTVAIQLFAENEVKHNVKQPIPGEILSIICESRQAIKRGDTAEILKQKRAILEVAESWAGIYEGYTLYYRDKEFYIQTLVLEIQPNGEVRYKSHYHRNGRSGRIRDVNTRDKGSMILALTYNYDNRYYEMQMTLTSNHTFEHNYGVNQCLIGSFGMVSNQWKPMSGRIIWYKTNEFDAENDYYEKTKVKLNGILPLLDDLLKSDNTKKRARILKPFIKGELDNLPDKPILLEKHPKLLRYETLKNREESIEYEPSDKIIEFTGYYYYEKKHEVVSFDISIDFLEDDRAFIEEKGLYRKRDTYRGLGVRYQDETVFASLENAKGEIINLILYTGSNYKEIEIILGVYQGVSPNSDSRISGEIVLVPKNKDDTENSNRAKAVETRVKRYLFGEQKGFLVQQITNQLGDLKINDKDPSVLAHLVGSYRALTVNSKKVFSQAKFIIEDDYRSTLISSMQGNQEIEYCKIGINTFDDESRLFVLSQDSNNFINGGIIEIPSRRSKVNFLEAAYFNFGYKDSGPYTNYIVFMREEFKENKAFEAKTLTEDDFKKSDGLQILRDKLLALIKRKSPNFFEE